eukprot:6171986-Pleurochrysis_carterae.AAC.4
MLTRSYGCRVGSLALLLLMPLGCFAVACYSYKSYINSSILPHRPLLPLFHAFVSDTAALAPCMLTHSSWCPMACPCTPRRGLHRAVPWGPSSFASDITQPSLSRKLATCAP